MITPTIPLTRETREHLRISEKEGETYEQILKGLMFLSENEEFMEKQYERLKDKRAFVSLDEL